MEDCKQDLSDSKTRVMRGPTPIPDTFSSIFKLLQELEGILPNRFSDKVNEARTTAKLYDAVLELGYAAGSKELRDTGDQLVHSLCMNILNEIARIASFFVIKLFPDSPRQKQVWEQSILHQPGGKYAFRNDDSLEISLLDSKLSEPMLHVGRIWSHVSSFAGTWTAFEIRLNATQVADFRSRQCILDQFRFAFDREGKLSGPDHGVSPPGLTENR